LFYTRFGIIWLVRVVLSFALAGLLPDASSPRDRWIGVGLAALLLLTISLNSHAAAQPEPVIPVLADWLHLVGAAVWVGGLTHFVAGLWAARQLEPQFRSRLTAYLIPRFSALAIASVGVLALTGFYAAVVQIGSFDALVNTLYGRTLIIKSLIALPMLGLGAINLLRVSPAMKKAAANQGNDPLVKRFRSIITVELTLGVVLFLSVGVLTAIPPARIVATAPEIIRETTLDDMQLRLSITPGRVGVNTFELTVLASGQPLTEAKEVLLRFTPASGKLPASEVTLTPDSNGRYTIKASNLSLPDNWQVQTVVRRNDKFDAFANFAVSLTPTASSGSFPWYRIAGGLLFVGGLLYLFAFATLGQTQRQLIGYGIIPALALAVISVVVFYREPAAPPTGIINPIPPNIDSISQGQKLYVTNCMPCHGQSGKGDGPVGLTLSPRPADLTIHTAPGVHEDGQLWLWISDGFPGSVMPAFRGSDEQRWHLVNYIRTLNK
jgi:putative copper export protein